MEGTKKLSEMELTVITEAITTIESLLSLTEPQNCKKMSFFSQFWFISLLF